MAWLKNQIALWRWRRDCDHEYELLERSEVDGGGFGITDWFCPKCGKQTDGWPDQI